MTDAGKHWCTLYPTSKSVEDLVEPFRRRVRRFLAELAARGCTVDVNATLRPAERAWLMHYAWRIARLGLEPEYAPTRPDIQIRWTKEGAEEMVAAYGLAYRPSLTSRHIDGLAIDLDIDGWTGTLSDLYALGATFGVHKLVRDPPHWSVDGA